MRECDSAYDRTQAGAVMGFLAALTDAGHEVQTYVTGAVSIDGTELDSESFDRLAMLWDGTEDGLDELLVDARGTEDDGDTTWSSGCYAEINDGTWTVVDPVGGVWWPSDDADEEISASADPAETALRIAAESPMRGTWHQ